MYDVALLHGARVHAEGRILGKLSLAPRSYVLATVHRAENTDDPQRLAAVVTALEIVATQCPVVWPLHPRTRAILGRNGQLENLSRSIHLIDPVGYLDMVQLEKFAAVVATDSGGVQKEAFFYRVPCVTLRAETEWVELVEAGWNRLAPPLSPETVSTAVMQAVGTQGSDIRPYGDGDAARRIVERLFAELST